MWFRSGDLLCKVGSTFDVAQLGHSNFSFKLQVSSFNCHVTGQLSYGTQFSTVTPSVGEVDETEYCGPYNGHLLDQFPGREHFMVVPMYKFPTYPQSIDFTAFFIMQYHKHPDFFVEIQARRIYHCNSLSGRAAASRSTDERSDSKTSEQFTIPTGSTALVLWGPVFVSTVICDKETAALQPVRIDEDSK
jgi:hypothetical protein